MHEERPPGDDQSDAVKPPAGISSHTKDGRFEAHDEDFSGANDEALIIKAHMLRQEHADLDAAIRALEAQPHFDRLTVARLKKKKLLLKDQIQAIMDQMTPDIIA